MSSGSFYGQLMSAGDVYTIAGNGTGGFAGDGGPATSSQLGFPDGVAFDSLGDLAVADESNNRVRFVPARDGVFFGPAMRANHIYTIAGNGIAGFAGDGGSGSAAELSEPDAVAFDQAGDLLLADAGNHRVRMVFGPVPGPASSGGPGTTAIGGNVGSSVKAPTVFALRQSASRWREGSRLARISKRARRPPIGTTFSFALDAQAAVSLSFTQRLTGREVGHKCVAKSRKNTKRKTCTRTVTVGRLSFTGHSATNKVVFQGRISRSKTLKPGRYTLIIAATNSSGASAPQKLSFTIVQ